MNISIKTRNYKINITQEENTLNITTQHENEIKYKSKSKFKISHR